MALWLFGVKFASLSKATRAEVKRATRMALDPPNDEENVDGIVAAPVNQTNPPPDAIELPEIQNK
jgi:hypothetical protein